MLIYLVYKIKNIITFFLDLHLSIKLKTVDISCLAHVRHNFLINTIAKYKVEKT